MSKFDWEPQGTDEVIGFFKEIKPLEVLYNFDGPRIYTFQNTGLLYLAYLCDEDTDAFRHIVAPTDNRMVAALKIGSASVYDALNQPWTWIIDLNGCGGVLNTWRVLIEDLPEDALPEKHTMLYPALDPIFGLKLTGATLHESMIPASVIKRGVDGACAALKKISQEVLEAGRSERPGRDLRQLFDLPMQRMAFGSFEIAFGHPQPAQYSFPLIDSMDENLTEVGRRLGGAMDWACGTFAAAPSLDLLEAVSKLAPPLHGPIEQVYVWGRILPRSGYALDRQASTKIRKTLANMKDGNEVVLNITGTPTEFDKERMSFRLKLTDKPTNYICRFQDEYYDELIEVFSSDNAVITVTLKIVKEAYVGDVLQVNRHPA